MVSSTPAALPVVLFKTIWVYSSLKNAIGDVDDETNALPLNILNVNFPSEPDSG